MQEFKVVDGKSYKDELIRYVNDLVRAGEMTYSDVADMLGEGRRDVYRVLTQQKATESHVTDRVVSRLAKIFDNKVGVNMRLSRMIVETSQYRIARAALAAAVQEPSFIVVIGAPGFGKTFAIEQFLIEHPGRMLFYRALRTDKSKDMLQALGYSELTGRNFSSQSTMLRRLIKRLSVSKEVIVIDEGDRLNYERLEILRDISDADVSVQKPKTSVVIFGNFDLDRTLDSGDWEDDTATTRSQLNRRVKRVYMKDLMAEDVITYCEAFEFPKGGLGLSDAEALVDLLNVNGGFGLLDQVRKILAGNVSRGKLKEEDITATAVFETLKQLITPSRRRYAR